MEQNDKPDGTTPASNLVFQETGLTGLKRLAVQLVFDSRASFMAPTAGLRDYPAPVARDSSYHLLYILDEGRMELDLQLNSSSKTHPYNLLGQVLGARGEDRRAFLIPRAGGVTLEAKIDDAFTFKFQNLAQGEYRLNVICDRELIEIVLLSL